MEPFSLEWPQLRAVDNHWEITQFMYLGLSTAFDMGVGIFEDEEFNPCREQNTWKVAGQALVNDLLVNHLEGTCYCQNWGQALAKVDEALAVFTNIEKRLDLQVTNLDDLFENLKEGSPEYVYAEALIEKADEELTDLAREMSELSWTNYQLLRDRELSAFQPYLTSEEVAAMLAEQKAATIKEAEDQLRALAHPVTPFPVTEEDPDGVA